MRLRLGLTTRRRWRRLFAVGAIILVAVSVLGALLAWEVHSGRRAAIELFRRKGLYMLYGALSCYADEHGRIPLAHTTDSAGKRMQGWRVSLLPYLDQKPLYSEVNLAEPWDSSGNRRLLERIPEYYRSPLEADTHGTSASYFAVLGPHAPWWGTEGGNPSVATTGRDRVLLIELIGLKTPWMKPWDPTLEEVLDIILQPNGADGGGGGSRAAGIMYLTIGGEVRTADPKSDRETLRRILLGLAGV